MTESQPAEDCWESLDGRVFEYEAPLDLEEPPDLSRLVCQYNNIDVDLRDPEEPIQNLSIGVTFATGDIDRTMIEVLRRRDHGFCSPPADPLVRSPDLSIATHDLYPVAGRVIRAWFSVSDPELYDIGRDASSPRLPAPWRRRPDITLFAWRFLDELEPDLATFVYSCHEGYSPTAVAPAHDAAPLAPRPSPCSR